MDKEKYYNKIKKWIYEKFNELNIYESYNGSTIYLHYKNDDQVQIKIRKNSGIVQYYNGFMAKIVKPISLNPNDFEILLGRWIEEKFKTDVIHIRSIGVVRVLFVEHKFKWKI